MKNIIFSVAICLMLTNSAIPGEVTKDFSKYRYNPFQWVYPEYFYKADTTKIDNSRAYKEKMTTITVLGLKGFIPKKYIGGGAVKKKDYSIFFKSESGVVMFILEDQKRLLCSKDAYEFSKDFCSAYSSAKEYYQKLFTLTPDTLGDTYTRGDLWLIHAKGLFFDDARKINIYEGKNFVAYVRTLTGEDKLKEEIILFHDDLPPNNYMSIGITFADKNFVTDFLSSLK